MRHLCVPTMEWVMAIASTILTHLVGRYSNSNKRKIHGGSHDIDSRVLLHSIVHTSWIEHWQTPPPCNTLGLGGGCELEKTVYKWLCIMQLSTLDMVLWANCIIHSTN